MMVSTCRDRRFRVGTAHQELQVTGAPDPAVLRPER
jgi:hypothetical protein